MIKFIKETYFTAFVIVFRIFPGKTPSYRAGAAISAITLIQAFVFLGILECIDMHIGRKLVIDSNKWKFIGAMTMLYFLNQYVLSFRGHATAFEREFDRLKRSKKIILISSCAVVTTVAVSFFVFSAIAFSRFISLKSAS